MALSKKNAKLFPKDEQHDATVIVPTMGDPSLVVNCVERLVDMRGDCTIKLVVPCNPLENDEAQLQANMSKEAVHQIVGFHNQKHKTDNGVEYEPPVELIWLDMGKPAGWPGAVNAGLKAAKGLAETIIIINDDATVCHDYVQDLSEALNSKTVHYLDKYMNDEEYQIGPGSPIEEFGTVGIVGPVSNYCAGAQKVNPPNVKEMPAESAFQLRGNSILDQFSESYKEQYGSAINNCDFLSGFCKAYSRDCLMELLVEEDGDCWLIDPLFGVGGFDDNDICARAFVAGYKIAIARGCYVHHQGHGTLDKVFPEAKRGLSQRLNFLKKWQPYTQREQKLIACSRVKLFRLEDLHMFRGACSKQGQLGDGLAILFTGNPADILDADDFDNRRIDPKDGPWLMACKGASPEDIAKASQERIQQWVDQVNTVDGVKTHECPVKVEVWTGDWHELHERNAAIELAQSLDADWILAFDHDEVIEDRIDRAMFRKLVNHPNPQVNMFDFGWINHWGTPEFHRTDRPWSNGYISSMRGYRMWRVQKDERAPNLIPTDMGHIKGLHCGNTPRYGVMGKRVAGVRFRHFGYVSQANRHRKHAMYTELDTDPDASLLGNDAGYDHLINQEGMSLSRYHPVNGIEFSMLLHSDDQLTGLYNWLDNIYCLADRICLVWTGPKDTNPSDYMKELSEIYGAHWVHEPFDNDLSKCRNAGLDYLRETKLPGTRWFWTMDDDESYSDGITSFASVRRMAECTDGWAWMFRFKNWRSEGSYNYSESARMFLMDPDGIMKFHGRVHETAEKSIKHLVDNGIQPQVRYMPFDCDHWGLAKDPVSMQKKLELYTSMLAKEIEDNPGDVGPWISLSLQYANEGIGDAQHICLEHAARMATNEYLPFKELGNFHLTQAAACFKNAHARLAPNHGYYEVLEQILAFLNEFALPVPKSGNASEGKPSTVNVDLSALLKLADQAFTERMQQQHGDANGKTIVQSEPVMQSTQTSTPNSDQQPSIV